MDGADGLFVHSYPWTLTDQHLYFGEGALNAGLKRTERLRRFDLAKLDQLAKPIGP